MVAGETCSSSRRATVRDPTGSPVATYASTIWRKTSLDRALSSTTIPVLGRSFNIGRYVGVGLPGVNASGPTTPRADARAFAAQDGAWAAGRTASSVARAGARPA